MTFYTRGCKVIQPHWLIHPINCLFKLVSVSVYKTPIHTAGFIQCCMLLLTFSQHHSSITHLTTITVVKTQLHFTMTVFIVPLGIATWCVSGLFPSRDMPLCLSPGTRHSESTFLFFNSFFSTALHDATIACIYKLPCMHY